MVKNLPEMWETWVWSLGGEDPLEKGMATHSSILAWEIPWTEEPGGLQSMEWQRVRYNWATDTFTFINRKNNLRKKNLIITLSQLSSFKKFFLKYYPFFCFPS